MRRIILSLAFCLLVFAPHPILADSAIKENVSHSSEYPEKSSLKKGLNHSVTQQLKGENPAAEVTYQQAGRHQNMLLSKNQQTRANPLIEEFSYNFAVANSALEARNPKKISTVVEKEEEIYGQASFANGMFYGFAIMVVLLNLICYFLFDEKVFLFYAVSLISIVNLLFFSDGLFPFVGLEIGPENSSIEGTLILLNALFITFFSAKYLNLEEVYPKLLYVSMVAFGASAVLVSLGFVMDQPALTAISNMVSYSVVVAHFGVGMYLFSKKNYPKFYVIAYFIPLLFAVDYFVFRNLGIEFLLTQPAHLKAAILVEMLLMSYAIVYRMRAIKEENELRQAELRIFLKRQEMMNRQSAMQLMEEVYLENLIMHYDLDGLEIKLLQYISEGKDNAKIARKLKTTESEIEYLTNELYKKLEIGEQVQQDYRMVDAQPDYIYN